MFVQLVLLAAFLFLAWGGGAILKESKAASYKPGLFLAGGLLLSAASLILYSIRDILIQIGILDIQYAFYVTGAIIQAIAGYCTIIFALTFTSKTFQNALLPLTGAMIGGIILAFLFGSTHTILRDVPFEPFPYVVVNHPWEIMAINIAFLLSIVALVGLVFGIFLSHMRSTKNRRGKKKLLFYAFGIAFLFLPTILSVLVSPIFARIGYLIGAALLFKAFRMKIE